MSLAFNVDNTLKAIVWDYDGTLVDTRRKNYKVTRAIVQVVTGRTPDEFAVLRTFASYWAATRRMINWRDLYATELGLSESETDLAGQFWTEYQLKDSTQVKVFDGLGFVLEMLDKFPQGIISMNSKENITQVMEKNGLAFYIDVIIGYEEVPFNQQKPAPQPLLSCLQQLINNDPGIILYIGDHKTDFECARNTNRELEKSGQQTRVFSVGAAYGYLKDDSRLSTKPDYWARQPEDILNIVEKMSKPSSN
jgi:HAD superfamily hydrolase (TIGR01549 family)